MLHVERWPEHRVSATPRSRAAIRREREREILEATRALFDDRPGSITCRASKRAPGV